LCQGIAQSVSTGISLQENVSNFSQQVGWELRQFTALLSGMRSQKSQASIRGLSRQIIVAANTYELKTLPQANLEEQKANLEEQI
jgi:hypothetical protein